MNKEIRFITNGAVFVSGSLPGPSASALPGMEAQDTGVKEASFSDGIFSAGPCQDPGRNSGPSEEFP